MAASTAQGIQVNGSHRAPVTGQRRFFKRALDVIGSALLLLLFLPVIALVALLIKLQDGGPVVVTGNPPPQPPANPTRQ